MNGSYLKQQVEAAQDATLPATKLFIEDTARLDASSSSGAFWRAVPRISCCLSMLLLLLIWPSSDWIGLLVLSQALFAAAHLLKNSSTGSSTKSSATSGPISLAQGEDHAH